MKPERSLPCLEETATGPYPESDKSSPYLPHPISLIFILMLSSNPCLGLRVVSSLQVFLHLKLRSDIYIGRHQSDICQQIQLDTKLTWKVILSLIPKQTKRFIVQKVGTRYKIHISLVVTTSAGTFLHMVYV